MSSRPAKITIRESRLERIFTKNAGHIDAHSINILVTLERDGLTGAVKALQRALTAAAPEDRPKLAMHIHVLGDMLAQEGHFPAAIEHLSLALDWYEGDDTAVSESLKRTLGNPAASAWVRTIQELSGTPEGLAPAAHDRFEKAIAWAHEGLWNAAGSAFGALAAGGVADAERNHGLCRLWLADEKEARTSLRRYIARLGETEEAVDLEGLCQDLDPETDESSVELVRLTWPLRDRDGLMKRLLSDPLAHHNGRGRDEETDDALPEHDDFSLLDKPAPAGDQVEQFSEIPTVLGHVFVFDNTVGLEAFDDGRIDSQSARFVELAGATIAPAHPKTEVEGKIPRTQALSLIEWYVPPKIDHDRLREFIKQERARRIGEVWPRTRLNFLNGRTPLEAAKAGSARVALRAAVLRLELTHEFTRDPIDFAALRARLGIGPEPEIDAGGVDIGEIHLSRLHLVSPAALDDDRLERLFYRADSSAILLATERTAEELVRRSRVPGTNPIDHVLMFVELATLAVNRDDPAAALSWMDRGRQTDPHIAQMANIWDIEEFRLRSRFEPVPEWVPRLVVVMDRVRNNPQATSYLTRVLISMGLVRVVADPHDPKKRLLDPSGLQSLITQFGPRITTASGEVGISAAQGGIWTPDSDRGRAASSIWTPGSGPAPPAGEPAGRDKPRLIVPGR